MRWEPRRITRKRVVPAVYRSRRVSRIPAPIVAALLTVFILAAAVACTALYVRNTP